MNPPYRQIRAAYDEESITVYQAYDPAVAEPAVAAQRFVAPFKRERMTWIKPSFLWMMYRCGWATKPGQARVLAIDLTHEGFAWALAHSCLSRPDRTPDARARPAGAAMTPASVGGPGARADRPDQDVGHEAWTERLRRSPVRIQWDPERDPHHNALPYRSVQIGLSGAAVTRYIDEWTQSITDVTERVHDLHTALRAGQDIASLLPAERAYPLPDDLAQTIGATRP